MKVYETAGKEAERELTQILGKESRLYRDDILNSSLPKALRLSSSFEEWRAWWPEPAYIRPGFLVAEDQVYIPCFLALISRVKETRIRDLIGFEPQTSKGQGLVYFNSFHMLSRFVPHENQPLEIEINTPDFLTLAMAMSFKPLDGLNPNKRRAYFEAIAQVIRLWPQIQPKSNLSAQQVFYQLIYGCDRIQEIFGLSIYQDQVVKCVIRHQQKDKADELAALRILLMHFLCFDIVILMSDAQASIEDYLPEAFYDKHILDTDTSLGDPLKGRRQQMVKLVLGGLVALGSVLAGILLL